LQRSSSIHLRVSFAGNAMLPAAGATANTTIPSISTIAPLTAHV
jgi:hypothetical protein